MSTVGIVAEFNPFHKGHEYIVNEAKRITGADKVVVIMSGNYVQRGTPAMMNKHLRVAACINSNVDMCIELPVWYAVSSAEYFATGAVSLLEASGIIDYLCFGSEITDINLIGEIADLLNNEPLKFKESIIEHQKSGESYPTARTKAIIEHFNDQITMVSSLVSSPNSILAIEYVKALKKLNSHIIPIAIKRIHQDYHNSDVLSDGFFSASAMRKYLDSSAISSCSNLLPAEAFDVYKNDYQLSYPINEDDFSQILGYKLSIASDDSLSSILDMNTDMSNRILKLRNNYTSYSQFAQLLKTKQYTYSRISRILLHIILDINKADIGIDYIHILGIKDSASLLINKLNNCAKLPLIIRPASYEEQFKDNQRLCTAFKKSLNADRIYNMICATKYGHILDDELEYPLYKKALVGTSAWKNALHSS